MRRLWRVWILAACVCRAQQPVELMLGRPLYVGEGKGVFLASAEAGDFLRISVEGTEVKLSAQGIELHDVDGALDYSWVAAQTGAVRIEIAREGPFDVSLAERRPAADTDRKRAQASSLEAGSEADLRKAVELYREASDRRGDALASTRLAARWMEAGRFEPAFPYMLRAVEFIGEVPTPSWQAGVWRHMGEQTQSRGQVSEALGYFEKSLALERRSGNQRGEVYTLNALALCYFNKGEGGRAQDLLEQALGMRRRLNDRVGLANGLRTLGEIRSGNGDDPGAAANFDEALAIWRETGNRRGEAVTLHDLAELAHNSGEYEKVIEYEEAARGALKESGANPDEPAILNQEAAALNALGEPERAADLLRKALESLKARNEPAGDSAARINLCGSERAMNRLAEALKDCTVALERARKAETPNFEAAALAGVGMIEHLRGNTAEGMKKNQQALAIFRRIDYKLGEARTLTSLGSMALKLGSTREAIGYLKASVRILHGLQALTLESYARYWLARAEAREGDMPAALRDNQAALETAESFRARIDESNLRASFFVTMQDYYRQQIELQMRMHRAEPRAGWDLKALETAESARARLLLDRFIEAKADRPKGAASEEQALRSQIVSASARLTRLLEGPHTPAQQEAAEKRVAELSARHDRLKAKMQAESRKYAHVIFPQPIKAGEIARLLQGSDTRLLEFALGENNSYAWLVSSGGTRAFTLPGRGKIEEAQRRAYAYWTGADGTGADAASQLSRLVLEPLGSRLNAARLLIVADGALSQVPFAALPEPGSGDRKPLIAGHEIVMLPSASFLMESRIEAPARRRASKDLAILADPVFDAADTRAGGTGKAGTQGATERAQSFERLRWSRVEAEKIAELSPTEPLRAFDFDAGRKALELAAAGDYRILHIASHSIVNERRPELSGIVLSLVDRNGKNVDGYIRAREIYDLRLRADLVVLSACDTALGKEVRGEGVMSLMRAFEYAGSPRVVGSIWKAPDAPTAELMQHFYSAMFRGDLPASAALRAAQLEMWKSGRWSDPRNWAGFVIEGEYR